MILSTRNPGVGIFADVDGDGYPDIVRTEAPSASGAGYRRAVYRNDRAGAFYETTITSGLSGAGQGAPVAIDVGADGVVDVLFEDLSLWTNDGNGVFVDATASRLPAGLPAWSLPKVAVPDADGDGDDDFLSWTFGGVDVRLFVQRTDGTFVDDTSQRMPWAGARPSARGV